MGNVMVVAHRGFSGRYPENTMIAFKKAIELGADFIELDVRETRDGKLVVIHDEKIDRTTDGKGYIKEMNYKEIEKYDAGKWKGYPGEKIPLLEEVFEECGKKIKILIEIKECDVNKLLSLIKKYDMTERVVAGSFNFSYLRYVRENLPELFTALISYDVPQNLNKCIKYGIRKLDIDFHNLNSEIVKNLTGRGFLINTWTPNTETELKYVLSSGVHFITTDCPDILLNLR